jgi:hypothetical protein
MHEAPQQPTDDTLADLRRELELARARVVHLEAAVVAHGRIGQAMGILMTRYGIGPEAAFAALRRVSQQHNVKLRSLAEAIIATIASQETPLPRELTSALEEILRRGEDPTVPE